VLGISALVEETAVAARMQSFYPAFQDFRERGEAGNLAHWDFFFP
jgi:hypothetical protein